MFVGGYHNPRRWSPDPDPLKQELPYRSNLVLSIRSHVPPPPLGVSYLGPLSRENTTKRMIAQFTHTAWVLKNPPAETPPHPDSTKHSLRVIDEIVCRDGRGTQIVRCHLDQDRDQIYVAKIYDPLYYAFMDEEYGTPADVTWLADEDYSQEAAAYEQLKEAGADGLFTPKYYGSWTFNVAFPGSPDAVRPVRMILMEWIQGVSMQALIKDKKVKRIPPEQRLNILAHAMEAETRVRFHGVHHKDFAPRNDMLVGSDIETRAPKIVLIDFNHSAVFSQPHIRYPPCETTRPMSPRYRYWNSYPVDFDSWIPEPHRSRKAVFKGWLKTRWAELGQFSGPLDYMKEDNDYDEPVEFASPLPDVEPAQYRGAAKENVKPPRPKGLGK